MIAFWRILVEASRPLKLCNTFKHMLDEATKTSAECKLVWQFRLFLNFI